MGFELQRRYDPQTVSVVVECSGTTALVLSELDINKQYIEHWSLGENTTNASRSRETTPSVSHVEQRRIFVLGKPRSRKDGLRFGNGDKVDFQLPKKGREYVTISGLQFRIHVNKYHSWMLIDESRNGTIVNNEALSSKRKQGCINRTDGLLQMQVALHPENPNRIQVGNLLFLVHIIGDTDNGYWSLSDDLSELADLGNLDLQTQTTLSTVKGPSLMLGSTQQARNDNHVLDSQVLSSSKQMRVKKVILKRTGEHAVGKIYATTTQEQLARAQFNYLFPVLKVWLALPKEVSNVDNVTG